MPIPLAPTSTFIVWPIAKQQEKDWGAATQQHLSAKAVSLQMNILSEIPLQLVMLIELQIIREEMAILMSRAAKYVVHYDLLDLIRGIDYGKK